MHQLVSVVKGRTLGVVARSGRLSQSCVRRTRAAGRGSSMTSEPSLNIRCIGDTSSVNKTREAGNPPSKKCLPDRWTSNEKASCQSRGSRQIEDVQQLCGAAALLAHTTECGHPTQPFADVLAAQTCKESSVQSLQRRQQINIGCLSSRETRRLPNTVRARKIGFPKPFEVCDNIPAVDTPHVSVKWVDVNELDASKAGLC